MSETDLNIDNYDYDDILNLFKMSINFGENDMKRAKRMVLLMHPDKSGLDKKYFLFFSAAYKILFQIYNFREKANASEKLDVHEQNTDYLTEDDKYNREILDSLKKNNKFNPNEFNKWFNNLFEKVKLSNEYEEGGYGDWIKKDLNSNKQCKNMNEINNEIEKKKSILRSNALSKHNSISEFNSGGYCDLTNSLPEEYSSGMFSKLQFEDLKKAHEQSVVPVTEEDYKKSYTSLDDAKFKRGQQVLKPLNDKDANDYLNAKNNVDNYVSSHRAYKLLKQEEEATKANNKFWASLKQIK